MPDIRYRACKGCGRSSSETGPLSWTRLCSQCGEQRSAENTRQIAAHEGPLFQQWRRACVAAFGGVMIDDLTPQSTGDTDAR